MPPDSVPPSAAAQCEENYGATHPAVGVNPSPARVASNLLVTPPPSHAPYPGVSYPLVASLLPPAKFKPDFLVPTLTSRLCLSAPRVPFRTARKILSPTTRSVRKMRVASRSAALADTQTVAQLHGLASIARRRIRVVSNLRNPYFTYVTVTTRAYGIPHQIPKPVVDACIRHQSDRRRRPVRALPNRIQFHAHDAHAAAKERSTDYGNGIKNVRRVGGRDQNHRGCNFGWTRRAPHGARTLRAAGSEWRMARIDVGVYVRRRRIRLGDSREFEGTGANRTWRVMIRKAEAIWRANHIDSQARSTPMGCTANSVLTHTSLGFQLGNQVESQPPQQLSGGASHSQAQKYFEERLFDLRDGNLSTTRHGAVYVGTEWEGRLFAGEDPTHPAVQKYSKSHKLQPLES
ncbi:hypothetical protein DFH07DRAFT_781656 [Mycena maculata]|uniref:Uncharacterized protein n=1 Tax=Mycena maculata TaxID=230809 RepID=A0AAD7HXL6_9AGAR|nr:hypothetical protein DFH07DRAFT_781656 [Mycena maculata]